MYAPRASKTLLDRSSFPGSPGQPRDREPDVLLRVQRRGPGAVLAQRQLLAGADRVLLAVAPGDLDLAAADEDARLAGGLDNDEIRAADGADCRVDDAHLALFILFPDLFQGQSFPQVENPIGQSH